jgi:hypothetical protein
LILSFQNFVETLKLCSNYKISILIDPLDYVHPIGRKINNGVSRPRLDELKDKAIEILSKQLIVTFKP